MSHPCLVTLDGRSAPRVLFAGDRLVEVALPAGARVLYPKPPKPALPELRRALRDALEAPLEQAPLGAQLRSGMRVTVVIDDASSALPTAADSDPRGTALRVLLEDIGKHGVNDVQVIVATGLRRKLTRPELRRMLGEPVSRRSSPSLSFNHDPEQPSALRSHVDDEGRPVLLNRRATESDLIIHLSVRQVPGEPLACALLDGLRGYEPTYLAEAAEAAPLRSWPSAPAVFAVALVANTQRFQPAFECLQANEDELSQRQRWLLQAALEAGQRLPQGARYRAWERARAPLAIRAVYAGSLPSVNEQVQRCCAEQCAVPLEQQADVLVTGVPPFVAFNAHAPVNPLLASHLVRRHLFGGARWSPLVRRGGAVILMHPCTDRFDHAQHAAYRDFVHHVLPETHDVAQLREHHERKFVRNPALLAMFRQGSAYHPAHPLVLWYWGQAARRYLGQVIVVGADNEYIPRWLGFQTAPNLEAALHRARQGQVGEPRLLCLHAPELVSGDVHAAEAQA